MNFDYMTNSQIAALIIGLVFSVIAVGTTFLSIKYAKRFDSFLKAIAITLVAPFIAFAAWLFLIFSFLDGFRNDELLNILISIVIALVICGVIIIIAKALYQKHQAELLETEFEKDREPIPEFEDEQKETLLIEDRKENEEESENEENNVEVQEDTTIENEDADIVENEDVDQQESEEQEETDTENEEPIEDETEENITSSLKGRSSYTCSVGSCNVTEGVTILDGTRDITSTVAAQGGITTQYIYIDSTGTQDTTKTAFDDSLAGSWVIKYIINYHGYTRTHDITIEVR